MSFVPHSDADRRDMLAKIGVANVGELYSGVPSSLLLDRDLVVPAALSEWEAMRRVTERRLRMFRDTDSDATVVFTAQPFVFTGIQEVSWQFTHSCFLPSMLHYPSRVGLKPQFVSSRYVQTAWAPRERATSCRVHLPGRGHNHLPEVAPGRSTD